MLTLEKVKNMGACSEAVEWAQPIFGDRKESEITVLEKLMAAEKYDWANWLIVRRMTRPQYLAYAIFAAEQVIGLFKQHYPNSNPPRREIEATKAVLAHDTEETRAAAWAACAAGTIRETFGAAGACAWAAGAAGVCAWAAWAIGACAWAIGACAWNAGDSWAAWAIGACAWAAWICAWAAWICAWNAWDSWASWDAWASWAAGATGACAWAAGAAGACGGAAGAAGACAWAAGTAEAASREKMLIRILEYGLGLLKEEKPDVNPRKS